MNLNRLTLGLVASIAASLSFSAQPELTRSSAATNFPLNLKATMNHIDANTPSKLTTLEVMGVGLSLEMFRQSQVWTEMKKHPRGSI